jgi:hypothetical protein
LSYSAADWCGILLDKRLHNGLAQTLVQAKIVQHAPELGGRDYENSERIKENETTRGSRKHTAANLVLVVVLELGLDEEAAGANGRSKCGDDIAKLSIVTKLTRACSNLEGHRWGELDQIAKNRATAAQAGSQQRHTGTGVAVGLRSRPLSVKDASHASEKAG